MFPRILAPAFPLPVSPKRTRHRDRRSIWLVRQEVADIAEPLCSDGADHFRVVVESVPGTTDKLPRFFFIRIAQDPALEMLGDRYSRDP